VRTKNQKRPDHVVRNITPSLMRTLGAINRFKKSMHFSFRCVARSLLCHRIAWLVQDLSQFWK